MQRRVVPMLSASGLVVGYGANRSVLDRVDLSVPDSGVVAVLGSNGAGKSTLLRTLSGTLSFHGGALHDGQVKLDDRPIQRLSAASIARAGVVQVPEGRKIFAKMTVEENLRVGAVCTPPGRRASARERVMELFPRLAERLEQRAGLLSGGEQQMLAMGRAVMASPRVLLLDEPSLGLAPKLIEQIGDIVTEISAQGTPVVLVEQNAAMALRVAATAVVLEVGRVAMSGEAEQLKDSDGIHDVYLGGHSHPAAQDVDGEVEGEATDLPRRRLARWTA